MNAPLSPELLRSCGEALYGQQWQAPIARDLEVALRTVQRWAAGEFGMPEGIGSELADLIRARRGRLTEIENQLRQASRHVLGRIRAGESP